MGLYAAEILERDLEDGVRRRELQEKRISYSPNREWRRDADTALRGPVAGGRGLVRMMGMRARQSQLPYRQYQDERGEVLLTLTGPGPVAVAAAVGAVLAVHGPASLVLVGSAAGKMTGQYVGPYRVNRLIDADGRRSFYPDLIYPYAFPLPEAALYSRSRIWTPGRNQDGL